MKRATVTDVAALAGVSISTVSRVINGSGKVDPQLAQKVNEAVASLGFTPNPSARHMRGKADETINIIIPTVNFSDMLRGAVDEAFSLGCRLNTYTSNGSARRDVECLERVASFSGGLIYCPVSMEGAHYLEIAASRQIPVVIAARRNVLAGAPHIYTDHVAACYRATKYLLQHHHRRVAMFAGFWNEKPESVDKLLEMRRSDCAGLYAALDRLTGYEMALKEFSLDLDPELVFITGFEYEDGYETCNKILASLCEFDAIICPTDRVAAGALQALQEQNVQVPNQVSIIGYDDGVFAQSTRPTLTAVHQQSYTIGRLAVQAIADLTRGKHVSDQVLDAELIVRNSTAAK